MFYRNCWDEWYQHKDSVALLYPRYWRTIALLKDSPDHAYFDQVATPEVENASSIIQATFNEMSDQVAAIQEKGSSLEWHRQRKSKISHMGRIPAFHSPPLPVGGDAQTLNAINSWGAGPSWRMIVAFGPEQKAYGVYPGGQSGNPGSAFYDNTIETWAKGEYYPLYLMKDEKDERVKPLITYTIQ